MNNDTVISIDLAKNIFQMCLLNQDNKVVTNKKVSRAKLLKTVLNTDAKRIVMEACYSSNHWGRVFQGHGFQVDLIPPHQVKPFVVGNKNDRNDAVAIAEASKRPKARFVGVKSYEQQDIQSLDRIRQRLIRSRTALANQLRGLLAEYGVVVKTGIASLRKNIPAILEDGGNNLTTMARSFINDLYYELLDKGEKIQSVEISSVELLSTNGLYPLLQTIPGIGPVIAGAIISSINDANQFKNGRQMAAWIGVTPKQHASGDNSRMGGISKRGNQTLRRQLIHGARSVVYNCQGKEDPLNVWVQNY